MKSENAKTTAQTPEAAQRKLELALQSKKRAELMKIKYQLLLPKKPTRNNFRAFYYYVFDGW